MSEEFEVPCRIACAHQKRKGQKLFLEIEIRSKEKKATEKIRETRKWRENA